MTAPTTDRPWDPGAIIALSSNYWQSCALHAGIALEVFTTVGTRTVTAEEAAEQLGAEARSLTMLLNALVAMRFLERRNGAYANTDASATFLSKESEQYIGHIVMHHHHLVEGWSRLDQAVRTNRPVRGRTAPQADDAWNESFLLGMLNLARQIAPRVAAEVDLASRRRLLDLGGATGIYAIHFCQQNPGLRATVFDRPTSRRFAETTISRFELQDRITFAAGDFTTDTLTGTYDVAWLSHILHSEGPAECRRLLKKVAAVLEPGGRILIHDFLLNDTKDGPLFPALFSLNMLLGTAGGQAYSESDIGDMLREAGATAVERLPFTAPNDSGIIAASFGHG